MLARVGSVIPVGPSKPTEVSESECECFPCNARDDRRGVEIFPPPEDHERRVDFFSGREWVEDDGIAAPDVASLFRVEFWYEVHCTGQLLIVKVQGHQSGDFVPLWVENGIDVILPVGSRWQLRSMSSDVMDEVVYVRMDSHGRHVWHMPCPLTVAECLVLQSIEPTDTTPDPAQRADLMTTAPYLGQSTDLINTGSSILDIDLMSTAPDRLLAPSLPITDTSFVQTTDLINTGSSV